MIIGIDATRAAAGSRTGVENFTFQLILNLLALDKSNSYRLYTDQPLNKDLISPANCRQVLMPFPIFWHQTRLPLELILRKPDVLLTPGYMLPPASPPNSIVVIHDLASKIFPKAYPAIERWLQEIALKRAVGRAERIIFVSQATRDDFYRFYDFPKDRTNVVPLAPNDNLAVGSGGAYPSSPAKPYMLFVGRLETRKNVVKIIEAYSEFRQSTTFEHKLFLVGRAGFGYNNILDQIFRAKSWQKDIILPGYLSDANLSHLYAGASFFVFPSLYEGFGLPILDAFKFGLPVITSGVSSMPEVAGQAALYVDPNNSHEIALAMKKLAQSDSTRQKLSELGRQQLKSFSWHKTAEQYLEIISSLVEKK